MDNEALNAAKRARDDEFYTRYEDIEAELSHYDPALFRGKIVYCNCDDYRYSNFVRYFEDNFDRLGLALLIATNCDEVVGDGAYVYSYMTCNGAGIKSAVPLKGNGSFDSPECIGLLEFSSIVVTNPPFSRFRDFVGLLEEKQKKYLIIGNMNAITYKEIFPLIKSGRLWPGHKSFSGGMNMILPRERETMSANAKTDSEGNTTIHLGGVCWFTNLSRPRREPLALTREYYADPTRYPHYDNYDAIEVSRVVDIPVDYEGVMGVPISFLGKWCPEQFELVGTASSPGPYIDGLGIYKRLLIRNRNPRPYIDHI